jgi:hypothetical protein
MKVQVIHDYVKDSEHTFKMLTDPTSHIKKYEAAGCKNITIDSCEEVNGAIVIKATRDAPSTAPKFAKKILGAYNTLVSEDIWVISDTPVKKGSFKIEIKGAPVTMTGVMEMRPQGDGAEVDIELELKVKVALIGKKIEPFLKNDTVAALDSDQEFFRVYEQAYI